MGTRQWVSAVRSTVRTWWSILLLAAVVRILYWAVLTPKWRPKADADQYVLLGRALADGRGFSLVFPQLDLHPTAFRPPLYPALLAPLNLVFGDALWPTRLLNLLIGLVVVVLAATLATRVGGRVAGLAAGATVALYPPLLANDTVALTEPLALALLLGALLLVDDSRWILGGIAVGALMLTRPNGYLVVVVLAVWAGFHLDAKRGAGVAVVALLVLAPWSVRNQIQVGTWRPTTSDGFTMAAMWAPPAQRAENFVDPVFDPAYDDPGHRILQFDEAKWNEGLSNEAIDALRENPGYLTKLVPRNARGYFELEPSLNQTPERRDGRKRGFRQATLPVFYLVTIGGLVGVMISTADRRIRVLGLIVLQFAALSLVLVAPPRLRAPFDLLMSVGFGLLIGRIHQARAQRRSELAEPRLTA